LWNTLAAYLFPNGQGTDTYPDGRKYVGEFKGGRRHGQETLTHLDGSKYVGEWKENTGHEQGTMTLNNFFFNCVFIIFK
jgi:hypothetical protein